MQKIALFSCHRDYNYGSMLQAYALVFAIQKLGYEAEYIDYYTYSKQKKAKVCIVIKRFLCILISFINVWKKKDSDFSFFKEKWFSQTIEAYKIFHDKYIPVSSQRYYYNNFDTNSLIKEYGCFIVGSDQLWSPFLYKSQLPYFLDFANFPNKNSYATSIGTTSISLEYSILLKEKLSSFNHISCREWSNCKLLTSLLGRQVEYVLDPTLLLDKKEWDLIASKSKIREKYILAYILGEKDEIVSFAQQLGNYYKYSVYYIVTCPKYRYFKNALLDVGPEDFVGLIKNAEYVVTDSFHGTLFSINYRVNFYAFSKQKGGLNNCDNVRIAEFLKMFGLDDRLQVDKTFRILPNINYDIVFDKLNILKQSSFIYLSKCINL